MVNFFTSTIVMRHLKIHPDFSHNPLIFLNLHQTAYSITFPFYSNNTKFASVVCIVACSFMSTTYLGVTLNSSEVMYLRKLKQKKKIWNKSKPEISQDIPAFGIQPQLIIIQSVLVIFLFWQHKTVTISEILVFGQSHC